MKILHRQTTKDQNPGLIPKIISTIGTKSMNFYQYFKGSTGQTFRIFLRPFIQTIIHRSFVPEYIEGPLSIEYFEWPPHHKLGGFPGHLRKKCCKKILEQNLKIEDNFLNDIIPTESWYLIN